MASERKDNSARPLLEVYMLGQLDFEAALLLQRRLVYDVSGSDGRLAALIVCEHSPIITVGRLGSWAHIDAGDEDAVVPSVPVRWVNRGGGCHLHVPGQLAVYPIVPFSLTASMRDYVRKLERCLVSVLREFGVRGSTRTDHAGIWTPAGQIASIGISMTRWVTYHGVTLNVSGPVDQFRVLHSGGNGAARVTTMEAVRQRPAPMAKVRECLVRRFVDVFALDRYHVFTQHPFLAGRTAPHVCVHSS